MAAYVKASDRRPQLISAARAVLARDGVNGLTLRSVAAEADTAPGTLHYVFATKELLLRAVLEDEAARRASVLGRASSEATGFEGTIRRCLMALWTEDIESHRDEHVMQLELTTWALRTKGAEELANSQYHQYIEATARLFENAATQNEVYCAVPYMDLARVTVAGYDGLIIQYLALNDPATSLTSLEMLIDQVVALADPQPAGCDRPR